MAAIVFPTSSAPGIKPQDGSGRIINGYAVKTDQGSRAPLKWVRSAGLRKIVSDITGNSHCRGMILVGSTLLVVMDSRVYAVTESGSVFSSSNLGALSGSDAVTIAQNNAGTPNIVVVCDAGTFNLFTGSAPTSFADGDLPSVNSVTAINGYLVFSTGGGEIWSTDLNSVSVQSDAFTSAEMPLRRVIMFRDELFAMGADGIKVYDEVGSTPFPLSYKKIRIPRGLCGTHAVVGNVAGWADELIWAGEDNIVYRLDGYTAVPISNDDVSRAIETAADRTLIEASAYMDGRNAFFVLTSPGEWTWECNVTTGFEWNERQSYGIDDWRARQSIRAFEKWIVGDKTTGKMFSIDNTYRREEDDALIWTLESGDNANFPSRIAIGPAYFDFTAAVGISDGLAPYETDPHVLISWSLDGGFTFGNELSRALGAEGEGGRLVGISSVGMTKAKGVRFKLRVSDPVEVTFKGGQLPNVDVRAA